MINGGLCVTTFARPGVELLRIAPDTLASLELG